MYVCMYVYIYIYIYISGKKCLFICTAMYVILSFSFQTWFQQCMHTLRGTFLHLFTPNHCGSPNNNIASRKRRYFWHICVMYSCHVFVMQCTILWPVLSCVTDLGNFVSQDFDMLLHNYCGSLVDNCIV